MKVKCEKCEHETELTMPQKTEMYMEVYREGVKLTVDKIIDSCEQLMLETEFGGVV